MHLPFHRLRHIMPPSLIHQPTSKHTLVVGRPELIQFHSSWKTQQTLTLTPRSVSTEVIIGHRGLVGDCLPVPGNCSELDWTENRNSLSQEPPRDCMPQFSALAVSWVGVVKGWSMLWGACPPGCLLSSCSCPKTTHIIKGSRSKVHRIGDPARLLRPLQTPRPF